MYTPCILPPRKIQNELPAGAWPGFRSALRGNSISSLACAAIAAVAVPRYDSARELILTPANIGRHTYTHTHSILRAARVRSEDARSIASIISDIGRDGAVVDLRVGIYVYIYTYVWV